jgi:hypothetical protein
MPALRGEAVAGLAELRLAQGRVEEAERLLAGFEDHEAAVPVRTRIHLLRGRPTLAVATVRRRLGVIGGEDRLEGAVLLELLGEAEIGQGQVEVAAERGRKLGELGDTLGSRAMRARRAPAGPRSRVHCGREVSPRRGRERVCQPRDALRGGPHAPTTRASPP